MSKKQKKIIKQINKILKRCRQCPNLDSKNPYLFDTKSTPKSFKPKPLEWWDAHITNKPERKIK